MGSCMGRTRRQVETGRDPCVKTQPLRKDPIKWKSEMPITMGQLHSKRDEFWDTAPVFEGRKEIWDAIRAAATAAEANDCSLAQAILDGANIYIPHGTLHEAYDELGNQYKVPIYCLSRPLNILCEDFDESLLTKEEGLGEEVINEGELSVMKLRLSSTGKDIDLNVRQTDSLTSCKMKLAAKTSKTPRQRWFYGGRLLEDKVTVRNLGIPDGHVIQVVFTEPDSTNANTNTNAANIQQHATTALS